MDAARYEAWHSHPRSPSYEVGYLDVHEDGLLQLVVDAYDAPLPLLLAAITPDGSLRFEVFAPDGLGTVTLASDGRSGSFDLKWIRGRLVRVGEVTSRGAVAEGSRRSENGWGATRSRASRPTGAGDQLRRRPPAPPAWRAARTPPARSQTR